MPCLFDVVYLTLVLLIPVLPVLAFPFAPGSRIIAKGVGVATKHLRPQTGKIPRSFVSISLIYLSNPIYLFITEVGA